MMPVTKVGAATDTNCNMPAKFVIMDSLKHLI